MLCATPGCRRRSDVVVATLLDARGVVEREDAAVWRPVEPGFGFVRGDAVRTGASSTARLHVGGSGVIRMDPDSRLRFLQSGLSKEAAPEVGVELGSAEIEQVGSDLQVTTRAGRARVRDGARVQVRANDVSASLEVLVGRAIFVRPDGEVAVEAGQGVRIRIGAPVVERYEVRVGAPVVEKEVEPPPAPVEKEAEPPPAPVAEHEPAPEQEAAAPSQDREPGAGPKTGRPDVTLSAGDSGTVHDTKPSPTLRLRFDRICPDDGVVEVSRAGHRPERFTGTGGVILKLRAGSQRYRVWCEGDPRTREPRASGTLALRHDAGNGPLLPRAPANTIEADGRLYTVLFQTRPPRLTLVWPAAPAGASELHLHIESGGGTRVMRVSEPRFEAPSGLLAEGKHTWWYSMRGGKESPRTTVTVRFDNAAPTAQFFRSPATATRGGAVAVDGVAMEDAKVSAAGKPVTVDDHGRFHVAATPLEGDTAVLVRLEPPRGGVHFYIRRPPSVR
jgi:hypothetical protein